MLVIYVDEPTIKLNVIFQVRCLENGSRKRCSRYSSKDLDVSGVFKGSKRNCKRKETKCRQKMPGKCRKRTRCSKKYNRRCTKKFLECKLADITENKRERKRRKHKSKQSAGGKSSKRKKLSNSSKISSSSNKKIKKKKGKRVTTLEQIFSSLFFIVSV